MPLSADGRLKRVVGFSLTSPGLRAWLWGISLFASILIAGLRLSPAPAGRVALGLIAAGFVLFGVARTSAPDLSEAPASCAPLLTPPMRALYWAGYALMFSGVVLTAAVSLGRIGR